MATVTHAIATANTANVETYTVGPFTPAANDLLVVSISISGTAVTPVVTTDDGLTFTVIGNGTTTEYFAIANQLANAVSQTLSIVVTGDAGTGCNASIERVAGMTKTGTTANKQSSHAGGVSGVPPEDSFDTAVQTGNPTIVFARINATAPLVTPPSGWTEQADISHLTPTTGLEVATRDSGFTGTTVTWGSNAGAAWGANLLELDASAATTFNQTVAAIGKGTAAITRAITFTKQLTSVAKGTAVIATASVVLKTLVSVGKGVASLTPTFIPAAVTGGVTRVWAKLRLTLDIGG